MCIRGERMRRRVFSICQEAVSDITDGATVMIGGWGSPGDLPQNLILALYEHGAKNLTIICNGGSTGQIGVAACGTWLYGHGLPHCQQSGKEVHFVY